MKYFPLIWAALRRKPLRAFLTLLSVTTAFTLFGLMMGLSASYQRIIGVSLLLGLGALFAAVNILYSSVSARTVEIATLRALGFGGLSVAITVTAEALALCLTGAVIGAAIAWALFDSRQDIWYNNVFVMTVSPHMIAAGIAWALAIALLGALLPSIRAARLPVATALRAT